MARLLKLRDFILIGVAVTSELIENTRLIGGFLPLAMNSRYGYVPEKYKKQSYLSTVSQMLEANEIKRTQSKDGEVRLELTSKGKRKYVRQFSFFNLQQKKWDGRFMFVSFDIPETDRGVRDSLRAKLVELGFGQLQKSVWISPYHFEKELSDYVKSKNLNDLVHVFSAEKIVSLDTKMIASKVWKLDEINDRYLSIKRKCEKELRKEKLTRSKGARLQQEYLDVLSEDPILPKELLPGEWTRETVVSLLNEILIKCAL